MPPLDGCDGMELFLNLLWLATAITALLIAPRRSNRAWFAIGCALVLLFPIVSVSDDLLPDRDSLEEALAITVEAVTLIITFVAIARVKIARPRHDTLLLVPSADPRSPPSHPTGL
jgi:hypothetical protein